MIVFAHGIVGRADLPIPEAVFAAAAAAVLVVSFAALAALWSTPKLQRWPERRLLRLPVAADVLLGALGVFVLLVTAYAGFAGTASELDNLAPTMVYVAFWVGVPFASLLLGDVWRLISPWRAIGRAAGWLARRVGGEELPAPLAYPERLGRWP
ncbi:MAG TPA: fenitrothion hydrolase, partial [Solirubrobacteraceae bacterium]|nr:fenitrothion hydrolase [Solirubrobacteraceae bacterium]